MAAWLDSHPSLFWAIAWASFAVLLIWAIAPAAQELRRGSTTAAAAGRGSFPSFGFVGFMALTVFVFRLPVLLHGQELNPDESHLIAEALALQRDWFYWQVVDGSTHGPLDVYPLYFAHLLGLPLDYFTARLVSTGVLLAAVVSLYLATRSIASEGAARLGTLPVAGFLMFSTYWDLVHFSSEQVPVAMLGVGLALLVPECCGRSGRHPLAGRWIAGGVVLGSVPLAKLQGGPIAAALLVAIAAFEVFTPGARWAQRLARVAALAGAALFLPVLFALISLVRGVGPDVWRSYIVHNLVYAADRHLAPEEVLRKFWDFAGQAADYYVLATGCTAFIVMAILRLPDFPVPVRHAAVLGLIALSFSVLVTIWPGRLYGHYLIWTVVPAGFAAAALLAGWWMAAGHGRGQVGAVLGVFLVATVLPQAWHRLRAPHPYLGQLAHHSVPSATERTLSRLAAPGSLASIWGWEPKLYVQSGLVPATKDAHTHNQIAWSPTMDYFRARYLRELRANPPPVFIDAVGPGAFTFQDRSLAHEMLPELRDFIAQNYRLASEVEGTRIYLRADASTR